MRIFSFYISICLKIHTFISWQSLNTKGANLDINWPKTIILMIYDTCWPRNENYEQYLEWGVIIWVNKTLCLAFLENHLFTAPGSFNSQLLVNALKTYTGTGRIMALLKLILGSSFILILFRGKQIAICLQG